MKRQSNSSNRQLAVSAQKDKRVLVLFLLGAIALCSPLAAVFVPSQPASPNKYWYNGQKLIVTKEHKPSGNFDEISFDKALNSKRALTPQLSILLNKPFPINKASQEELQLLPGVGPSLAEKIYTYRLRHGNFLSIEQLVMVPGIGTKTAATLQPLLTFTL